MKTAIVFLSLNIMITQLSIEKFHSVIFYVSALED